MIDDIYTASNPYPPAINFDTLTHRVGFFLGDRWINVGNWETVIENKGEKNSIVHIKMPDMVAFFQEQRVLDNGADVWAEWGPRVN